MSWLDSQPSEGEYDAGEDVYDDLLIYAADLAGPLGSLSEDDVAAKQASKEGVVWAWSRGGQMLSLVFTGAQGLMAEGNTPSLPGVGP